MFVSEKNSMTNANDILNESFRNQSIRLNKYNDDPGVIRNKIHKIPKYHILHLLLESCYNFLADETQKDLHEKLVLLNGGFIKFYEITFTRNCNIPFLNNKINEIRLFQDPILNLESHNAIKKLYCIGYIKSYFIFFKEKNTRYCIDIDQGFFKGWKLIFQRRYYLDSECKRHPFFEVALTKDIDESYLKKCQIIDIFNNECPYDIHFPLENKCTCATTYDSPPRYSF